MNHRILLIQIAQSTTEIRQDLPYCDDAQEQLYLYDFVKRIALAEGVGQIDVLEVSLFHLYQDVV